MKGRSGKSQTYKDFQKKGQEFCRQGPAGNVYKYFKIVLFVPKHFTYVKTEVYCSRYNPALIR